MLLLILLLMLCHWAADFTHLSTPWMINAKQYGKPLFPILIHALVHAVLMGFVLMFFTDINKVIMLAGFELITHFIIDVWKGRMNGRFPALSKTDNPFHWWLFGIDQFFHQLVIIVMVFWLNDLI